MIALVALVALGAWEALGAAVSNDVACAALAIRGIGGTACGGDTNAADDEVVFAAARTLSRSAPRATRGEARSGQPASYPSRWRGMRNPGWQNLAKELPAKYEREKERLRGGRYGVSRGRAFVVGSRRGERAIDPGDVSQGAIGDCWLMASLAALAKQRPEALRRALRANENGTFTISLYEGVGTARRRRDVTVTPELPVDADGNRLFADEGDPRELWPALFEKAFAQKMGSYTKLNGGVARDALDALGETTSERLDIDRVTLAELDAMLKRGDALVTQTTKNVVLALTLPLFRDGTLVTGHGYDVQRVDRRRGTVTLGNPWGWGESVTITFHQYQDHFSQLAVSRAP